MIRTSSELVLAGLVFAGVAALSVFGKSKPTDTPINEPAFHLTLPGQWSSKPSSDPTRWVYHTGNGEEFRSLDGLIPVDFGQAVVDFGQ